MLCFRAEQSKSTAGNLPLLAVHVMVVGHRRTDGCHASDPWHPCLSHLEPAPQDTAAVAPVVDAMASLLDRRGFKNLEHLDDRHHLCFLNLTPIALVTSTCPLSPYPSSAAAMAMDTL